MKINSTPVSFLNTDGHKLFGILHKPKAEECRKECIIILSPGIKSRVAPHRLYIKMAKAFVDLGFPVLRFDFYGLGDSEGEIEEKYAADFYGSVQLGRYTDDTVCAMDYLEREHKISNFILSGLCGGAITGLLTAAQDNRVKGFHSLAIPIILDGSNIVYDEFLTTTELKGKRAHYLSKLLSIKAWKSWVRFLTFQSDYRLIFGSVFHSLAHKSQVSSATEPESETVKTDNKNPLFSPSFHQMVSAEKQILFVFAQSDRLYWQFKENFIEANNISLNMLNNIELHIIPHANHIFSFNEWQEELIDKSSDWLKAKFQEL